MIAGKDTVESSAVPSDQRAWVSVTSPCSHGCGIARTCHQSRVKHKANATLSAALSTCAVDTAGLTSTPWFLFPGQRRLRRQNAGLSASVSDRADILLLTAATGKRIMSCQRDRDTAGLIQFLDLSPLSAILGHSEWQPAPCS